MVGVSNYHENLVTHFRTQVLTEHIDTGIIVKNNHALTLDQMVILINNLKGCVMNLYQCELCLF